VRTWLGREEGVDQAIPKWVEEAGLQQVVEEDQIPVLVVVLMMHRAMVAVLMTVQSLQPQLL
jgi:hypothetical protein